MIHIAHSWLKFWAHSHFHLHGHPWRTLLDSTLSAFYFFLFLLSVPVFLFHLELFPELLYTKVMANLRLSTAKESEDTLNAFTSPTSKEESVWRNKKAQKLDRFLRGRQIAYLIYDYFRVTGIHDSVGNYADLFTFSLRNDDIQEFDSKWDGILLSMTKIASDDILEGLYKLRIRESEKLKTVLELYNVEIHQKKAGPDCHRLKTMVKRSIEQDSRNRIFEARNGNYERNAVVKNQGIKQRAQRILGDCWQWETNGQCSKGDNCSFRHDINKRVKMTLSCSRVWIMHREPEVREAKVRVEEYLDCPARITSKETCTNSFCEKWHPPECLFYKSENGCRFGEKCSHAHRQVDEQPSERSKKNGDKSAVAMLKITRQLDCIFQDMEPPKSSSILRKSSDIRKPIRFDQFTEPWYVMLTFETKIHRLEWFAQVILISVTPMLQN